VAPQTVSLVTQENMLMRRRPAFASHVKSENIRARLLRSRVCNVKSELSRTHERLRFVFLVPSESSQIKLV